MKWQQTQVVAHNLKRGETIIQKSMEQVGDSRRTSGVVPVRMYQFICPFNSMSVYVIDKYYTEKKN